MAGDAQNIRERLDVIAEELAELAIESLRTAIAAGEDKRPAAEKRLTQARRAVEKAAGLLKERDSDGY